MNHSPWIDQLQRIRPAQPLAATTESDIVIVGGGIAGITTAYFLLTRTDRSVLLLEADKIAHGATGHNAGQITSYFEVPFKDMVSRFGMEQAAHAQKVINEDARVYLEEIIAHVNLEVPFSQFVGYDGWTNEEQVIEELENLLVEEAAGIKPRPLLVAGEWAASLTIPAQYRHLYQVVSQTDILSSLQTADTRYIAATPFQSGCMNSALFCEELVSYLLGTFTDRCIVYEHTLVHSIHLLPTHVILDAHTYQVEAKEVILCTNGFENCTIYEGNEKTEIDRAYHRNVEGVIGFMAGYLEPIRKPPFTGSYNGFSEATGHLITDSHDLAQPYFYTTRRPYDRGAITRFNLLSIGGPDRRLPEGDKYDPHMPYPRTVAHIIASFAKQTYMVDRPFDFYWHGLMGYTSTGFRIIGPDPKQPRLLYNLGCNGVGILPSIYGAHRISRIINGEAVEATIFDPQ